MLCSGPLVHPRCHTTEVIHHLPVVTTVLHFLLTVREGLIHHHDPRMEPRLLLEDHHVHCIVSHAHPDPVTHLSRCLVTHSNDQEHLSLNNNHRRQVDPHALLNRRQIPVSAHHSTMDSRMTSIQKVNLCTIDKICAAIPEMAVCC